MKSLGTVALHFIFGSCIIITIIIIVLLLILVIFSWHSLKPHLLESRDHWENFIYLFLYNALDFLVVGRSSKPYFKCNLQTKRRHIKRHLILYYYIRTVIKYKNYKRKKKCVKYRSCPKDPST